MSGIIEKVKDVLHHNKDTTSTTGHTGTTHTHGTAEGAAGPHSSRAANAADPRVDSDLDGSRTAGGTTGTTGTHGTHTHGTHTHGTAEGVAGPHSSRAANAADPRVDSDLDGSRTAGTTGHGTHTAHTGTGAGVVGTGHTGHGTHTTHAGTGHTGHNTHAGTGAGTVGTGNTTSTNAGPHNSNVANKLDPRVDSDLDGSRNLGAASHTGTAGTAGAGTTGYGSTHAGTTAGGYGGTHSGNTTTHHTGTAGGISNSTNAGPHNSNLANKADPRVDSDLDGRGNRHGAATGGLTGTSGSHATPGSGTAQNTAGPHNSDLLNKLDPRVDADLDGSKTYGGNKTHS